MLNPIDLTNYDFATYFNEQILKLISVFRKNIKKFNLKSLN